jgi:hypothetical protein
MPRTPSEFIIHMLFDGGHHEQVRFNSLQDFQKWYKDDLMPNADSNAFIKVPLSEVNPGEHMVIRPARLLALRVEPVFSSSVERWGGGD